MKGNVIKKIWEIFLEWVRGRKNTQKFHLYVMRLCMLSDKIFKIILR